MHIYFLRHGDASSESRYPDGDRPLTDLGKQQAERIGVFLHRMNILIDAALSSPLKRAQETASLALSLMKHPKISSSEYLLNGTRPQLLLDQLNQSTASSVLLIGHEPFLSESISLLIGGNKNEEIEMKKCSLALVDISIPIRPGTGRLKYLIPVETLT